MNAWCICLIHYSSIHYTSIHYASIHYCSIHHTASPQATIDYQIVAAGMDELVLIGVDNTMNRTNEYTYSYDPTVPGGGNVNHVHLHTPIHLLSRID